MYKFVRIKFAIYSLLILAFFIHNNIAYGAFGENCPGVPLPVGEDITYLRNNTAYGYIQNSLNITEYVPVVNTSGDSAEGVTNCNNNVESVSICIKNDALNPPCDFATLTPGGASVSLSSISRSALLGQNPLFNTLTLKAEYIATPACTRTKNVSLQDVLRCTQSLCITMPTPYGNQPLVCKQISHMTNTAPVEEAPPTCSIISYSCNKSHASQSLFSFTGPAIECLTETLHNVFFDPQEGCVGGDANINMSFLASFASFQESLKVSVRALLILYTMGYGITLLMNPDKLTAESVVMFVLKMVLVGYFSVGWGPVYFTSGGVKTTHSGMLEWGLPILTQMTSDLAALTFDAGSGGRGLCDFDNSHYPEGKGYFGLWDRIDCKLGAYIMVKKIYGFGFLSAHSFSNGYTEISRTGRDNTDSIALGMNAGSSRSAATSGMATGSNVSTSAISSVSSSATSSVSDAANAANSAMSGAVDSSNEIISGAAVAASAVVSGVTGATNAAISAAEDAANSAIDATINAASKMQQIGMSVIMFLLLLGGNIIVVVGLVYFVTIILSLIFGFVSLYTVCLVTLHVLIYISPIFVPMALFQRTKTYFDSWLKVTLSCALQPMVMAGFIAFAMNMYDDVLFGGCQFRRHDYSNGERFFSTFEPRLPQGDYESCITTPGFMIINYVLGVGWSDYGAIFFTVDYAKDQLNLLANTCLLIVFSYIMGFFLDVVYSMASDLTGGLSVASVALNMKNMARAMQNKLNSGVGKVVDKLKEKSESKKDGGQDGGKSGGAPSRGGAGQGGGAPAPSMGGGGGAGGGEGGKGSGGAPPSPNMGA